MEFFIIILFCFCLLPIGLLIAGVVSGLNEKHTNQEARSSVEDKLKQQGFNIEKQVGLTAKLYVDNTNKLWAIYEWGKSTDVKVYKYSDLIDFELLEDNESLVKGGFGKALIGGAIGGTKGAIIGSAGSRKIKQNVTLLEVKIRTNDFEHPQYSIQLIKGFALPKNSSTYREHFDVAQEIIGVLNYIATNGNEMPVEPVLEPAQKQSLGDQLRELDQLRIEGIITSEEFETKKKELLAIQK